MLADVLKLFVQFATIGGGLWLVWGAISTGLAMNDHNGPAIKSGVMQVVGGGMVIGAAQLFSTIAIK